MNVFLRSRKAATIMHSALQPKIGNNQIRKRVCGLGKKCRGYKFQNLENPFLIFSLQKEDPFFFVFYKLLLLVGVAASSTASASTLVTRKFRSSCSFQNSLTLYEYQISNVPKFLLLHCVKSSAEI